MKKAAAGCFAVACIVAVLVAVLASIGQMRQEKIRQQPPLTIQDLDRLSKALKNPEEPATSPNEADESPGETPAKEFSSPASLPRRLDRTATNEQRREFFTRGKSRTEKLLALGGSTAWGGLVDAALVAGGVREGASWGRGQVNLICGNWAEARSCFTEYLRHSEEPVMQQRACAYLAWIEDDPEVAARYMEIACSGRQQFYLGSCARLSRDTGNTELADYYIALYKGLYPPSLNQRKLRPIFDSNRSYSNVWRGLWHGRLGHG